MAINPTQEDVGRAVEYHNSKVSYTYDKKTGQKFTHTEETVEQGVLTSFNDHWCFIRYGNDPFSRATRRADLEWMVQHATSHTDQGGEAGTQDGNSPNTPEQG